MIAFLSQSDAWAAVRDYALVLILVLVCWKAFWKVLDVRDRKKADRDFRKWWDAREKCEILEVGHLVEDAHGRLRPRGFRIKGNNSTPEWMRGPDGQIVWGGYTEEELIEMVRRRSEFQP